MGIYESVVMVIFSLMAIAFVWAGIELYRQAGREQDKDRRRASRRKAHLWMAAGLMSFLSALYIVVRASWIAMIVVLMGSLAVAYVIGAGLGANMKQH